MPAFPTATRRAGACPTRRPPSPRPGSASARARAGSGVYASAISARGPLKEDNSQRSKATALLNGRIGYAFAGGVSLSLDVLNLTNAKADQITYYYESRRSRRAARAREDRHFHPVEPTAVRLTLAGRF